MLKKSLTKNTIKLKATATTWEDAIKQGAKLLENEGAITDVYTENMINNIEKHGPYIVIAPGIALPHANSKEGVNKNGVSLLTLKEPVKFGHVENDPVNIVITLAAIDSDEHLSTIQNIVELLNKKSFLSLLGESNNPDEVYEYIKNN